MVSYAEHSAYDNAIVQTALVNGPCGRIRVFNHHPMPWSACRTLTDASDTLLAFADGFTDARHTFLLGDFNITTEAACYPAVDANHDNACTVYTATATDLTCLDTVVVETATFAVDHIFYRNSEHPDPEVQWILADHRANEPTVISDHWPVVGRFTLR